MTLLLIEIDVMNITLDTDLRFAKFGIEDVVVVKQSDTGTISTQPLLFKEPVGHYTLNASALYCGRTYTLGVKINNLDLKNKLNTYTVELSHGTITETAYYDYDLDLVIFRVNFKESVRPVLDPLSLPEPLWTLCSLQLFINDLPVPTVDKTLVEIPLSYNIHGSVPTGDKFYNSDEAVMVIQPGERLFFDLTSAAGGGAGLNLTKGENKAGENGGDAGLFYIEPETGEIKPIVFLEGGLGGRLSTQAFQEFKPRECKKRVFMDGYVNQDILIEVIERGHHLPSNDINSSAGGEPHEMLLGEPSAKGGDGGYKEEIGYRGEGGFSGGRAVVQIHYKPFTGTNPGPFIILHPKTMVNIFGIIKDKDLKIKKTKKPMIGGTGGFSLTQSGEDGQDGTLIVSI